MLAIIHTPLQTLINLFIYLKCTALYTVHYPPCNQGPCMGTCNLMSILARWVIQKNNNMISDGWALTEVFVQCIILACVKSNNLLLTEKVMALYIVQTPTQVAGHDSLTLKWFGQCQYCFFSLPIYSTSGDVSCLPRMQRQSSIGKNSTLFLLLYESCDRDTPMPTHH